MPFRSAAQENFRFLLFEVTSQIEGALATLRNPDTAPVEKIAERDDYIDNLKGIIENKCFSQIFEVKEDDKRTVDLMKATMVASTNLERIADYAVSIVQQVEYYRDRQFIHQFDFEPFFKEINQAMEMVGEAMEKIDLKLALRICHSEFAIDDRYKAVLQEILQKFKEGDQAEDCLTTVFVFRYLERMGDCLLNIGEAVISAAIGEKLKIHQFHALEETLEGLDLGKSVEDLTIQSFWETRSGCRIARLENSSGEAQTTPVLFKQGLARKLDEERTSIARWEQLAPGLTPKVYGFEHHGKNGLLLLEYLSGRTLKDMLLNRKDTMLEDALITLTSTLNGIWTRTKQDGNVNAHHFGQLLERLETVHRVHPEYKAAGDQIGSVAAPSLEDLIARALPFEEHLMAPFSVMIHGDLNVDNILFSPESQRVHFIDLHRSTDSDYVQDVAVFMISNYRMPVHDSLYRGRLNWMINEFYRFAADYARRNNDTTFEARLTLGLVRSFVSSTRFELQEEFANSMYLRARFLLEKMLAHDGRPWNEFSLPQQALTP